MLCTCLMTLFLNNAVVDDVGWGGGGGDESAVSVYLSKVPAVTRFHH
jgi:hypothetical protein